MEKIVRNDNYQIKLEIINDSYINPPRRNQRSWLIAQLLKEISLDLDHLHKISKTFVPGGEQAVVPLGLENATVKYTQGKLKAEGQAMMENWQTSLMKKLAILVTRNGGDVLEIGFGMGLSAEYIQSQTINSHTIVECNSNIIDSFYQWKTKHPSKKIHLIKGKWQDVNDQFKKYHGILFDTYPLNQYDFCEHVLGDITYAAHFFKTASDCLHSGGVFTYFTGEYDSLSREHQRLLLNYFSSFKVSEIKELSPSKDSQIWWSSTMAIVEAIK